jgi:hypothetical protein
VNELLNIIDDFVDLKIERERDEKDAGHRWHHWMRERESDVQKRFEEAFNRAVAKAVEDIEHQRSLLR